MPPLTKRRQPKVTFINMTTTTQTEERISEKEELEVCEYCGGSGEIEGVEMVNEEGNYIVEKTGKVSKCFNCNYQEIEE